HPPDWTQWRELIAEVRRPKKPVRVAIVGKYVELQDAYMSVREALHHAGLVNNREVQIEWLLSSDLEKDKGWDTLSVVDGVVVPGGFGERGIEGKILAANWAREKKVPYLGLCLGMQVMCIEFARAVLGDEEANSTEFDSGTPHPIIDLMADQRDIADMGGTMRLGIYPCKLVPGTKAAAAYGEVELVNERHRHRFEFNNAYREPLGAKGLVFSGLSPDGRLVEISEIADHPFMVGSQFHPEFTSRPNRPNPLFKAFLAAVAEYASARLTAGAGKKAQRSE
ncbi:MAG: CTP synthase, partial [Chloroflexota bacterium]